MQQQVPELLLMDPEAAQALINVAFLGQFREPASPSDVARKIGMPANLAHHHAQKCLRLGLLFEARREKGKVLYQLAALSFRMRRDLSEAAHFEEAVFDRSARQMMESFLAAKERSYDRLRGDSERWSICTFGTVENPAPAAPINEDSTEPRPALFVQRTVKLTPEKYKNLLSRINELIQDVASERENSSAATCTIAALGFEGVAHDGLSDDSLTYSAFFTPNKEESL